MRKLIVTLLCSLIGFGAAQSDFPLTITDGLGRELTFDAPPQRIVAIWNSNFGQLASLGVRPVGTITETSWLEDETYFFKDGTSIPQVETAAGEIDAERIAELGPDLILAQNEEDVPQLEAVAPVFANGGLPDKSLEASKENLRLLGRILDREDAAEAAIASFEDRLAAYQERVEGEAEPTVMIVRSWGDDQYVVYTAEMPACQLLDAVASCTWTLPTDGFISLEGLLSFDPDVIVLGHNTGFQADDIEALLDDVATNPLWQELSAVKNDRVVYIENYPNQTVAGLATAVRFLDLVVPRIYPETFAGPLSAKQIQDILAN